MKSELEKRAQRMGWLGMLAGVGVMLACLGLLVIYCAILMEVPHG